MNIQFNAAVIAENNLYFSAKNFNGLFRMDLENEKVDFIGHFPGDKLWVKYMHQFAIHYQKTIYFIPYFAHCISKYNYENGQIESIEIGESGCGVAVSSVLECEKKYFLIPRQLSNPIVTFNPQNDEISYLPVTYRGDKLKNSYSDNYSSVVVNNEVLIPVYGESIILKYSLSDNKWSDMVLPGTKNSSVTFFDDSFWIVSSDGKEINRYSKEFVFLKKYLCNGKTDRPFEGWINTGNNLFLCGCLDDRLIRYNKISETWENVDCNGVIRQKNEWAFMCGFAQSRDELYIFPSATNALSIVSDERDIQIIEVNYENIALYNHIKEEKGKYYFEAFRTETYTEQQELTLEDFVFYLSVKYAVNG